MKYKNVKWLRFIQIAILVSCILILGLFSCLKLSEFLHPTKYIVSSENIIVVKIPYKKDGEIVEDVLKLPRGTEVEVRETEQTKSTVRYENKIFTIDNHYLADSLDECVQTEYVYPRRLVNLYSEKNGKLSSVIANKGEELKVVSVSGKDLNSQTGVVNWYKVEKEDKTYWINGNYVETTEKLANKTYSGSVVYSTYWDQYY